MASYEAIRALERAENGISAKNERTVMEALQARGLTGCPRVNVFTRLAWNARQRVVKESEYYNPLCKVLAVVPDKNNPKNKRLIKVRVYHISQTDPLAE